MAAQRGVPFGRACMMPTILQPGIFFWKYIQAGLFLTGIDGWWMDSSEPDHLQFKASDLDNKTYLGSFRKVRNAFPLMTVGGVYQHQRAESSR